MSPADVFIRIGTATQPMTPALIESLFFRRTRSSLRNILAPNQDLAFVQLKIFYEENGLSLTNQFAKYRGRDKSNLVENKDFGYCSLNNIPNSSLWIAGNNLCAKSCIPC